MDYAVDKYGVEGCGTRLVLAGPREVLDRGIGIRYVYFIFLIFWSRKYQD